MIDDIHLNLIAAELAETLLPINAMLVTAESCTGGWIAKTCTDLPGSSGWFDRGFITYSNDAKNQSLSVPMEMIHHHGAVSQEVASAMATGALNNSTADFSIAATGIAGPDGGSELKPIGTVWLAWGAKNKQTVTRCFQFKGDRNSIRKQAVYEALKGIIKNARD